MEQVLDDEGPNTLMCKVECINNGRPITYLRPVIYCYFELEQQSHPVYFPSRITTPVTDCAKCNIFTISSGHTGPESTCRRYSNAKSGTSHRVTSLWMILLLPNENTPCRTWPLARLLEVHSNCKDGLVHSAEVKTNMSVLVQPVDMIVLLEAAEMTSKG